MPNFFQYVLIILGSLAVISYAYGQWKQGRNQSSLDSSSIYKERIEALELKVKLQSADIEALTEQVKRLRKDNEEANKKLLEALAILQGRNPSMDTFIKQGGEFMTVYGPTLNRLDKFLDKQVF